MSIVYTLDTTANAPVEGVSLKKLGIRNNITHPTTGFNLTDLGLTPQEIQNSEELADALTSSWIILYVNGVIVSSPDVQPAASQPQQVQNIIANTTPGVLVQTTAGNYASRSLTPGSTKVQVNNGNGVSGNPSVDVNEPNLNLNNIGGTLAINKGGTGQTAALAGFNALSPLTTKGDLLSRDGSNNIRVPVGVNNRYLVADSAQTSGLDWKGLDVDSQTVVGGAPLSVLNLTNSHPNSSGITWYQLDFGSVNYTTAIATAGRSSKNYIVTFSGTYGINSILDRYTHFRFIVGGLFQPQFDIFCFTTDTYRPTQFTQTFTLNNISPGIEIGVVYGVSSNIGTSSPGSTTLRNYGMTLSIYGVG